MNNSTFKYFTVGSVFLLIIISCSKDPYLDPWSTQALQLPQGFPAPVYPLDNYPNALKIELGKKLFFDPILSKNNKVSCASCHMPEKKFTDGLAKSVGINSKSTERNSPSLLNITYSPHLNRDGGVKNLELQVLVPLLAKEEMGSDPNTITEKLNADKTYKKLFLDAFGTDPDMYSVTRSIAAFERTLISGNSPFDAYFYKNQRYVLTEQEKKGMALFFSEKTQCSSCHSGFNFTNYSFENIGLYSEYTDPGRYRITLHLNDVGKFLVPSLRNVEHTAPYMHDGSLQSLEDVITHYARGGKKHSNQSHLIRGFTLTSQEKEELIAFLKSLSDYSSK